MIVVNRAMLIAPRADYWCCCDAPGKVMEDAIPRAQELGPKIITKRKKLPLWKVAMPGAEVHDAHKRLTGSWVYEVNMHGTTWSAFVAVAWATHLLGATRVQFTGVTLAGKGYFDGSNPMGWTDADWELRWRNQRRGHAGGLEVAPWYGLVAKAREKHVELAGLPEWLEEE